jgi:acetoacetyl-CoA synthetase
MNANLLWEPSESFRQGSNLRQYMEWLKTEYTLDFTDYSSLWKWSVDRPADFWESLWKYFNILSDGAYTSVMTPEPMPFVKWFDGSNLNYAEHVFRNYNEVTPAILFKSETSALKTITWKNLRSDTSGLQNTLRDHGVAPGDTVAAYLPCIPEATVAFLATNSLGAIWSSCSPDFGTGAVIDRFAQIKPKVFIAVDSYQYGGKSFPKKEVIEEVVRAIPSIELIIVLSAEADLIKTDRKSITWKNALATNRDLTFARVPFNHPIWVLYSSGTTGLPKAITHSVGGVLLETLKYCTFHNDFRKGDRCFWYTTTGWMMWNYIHGSLLTGSTMVLYDGSPAFPDLNILWKFVGEAGINHFGTSAGFILANMKEGIRPMAHSDLSMLRSIGSTGSTLPPEGFEWVYAYVKKDLWLASMSGGTDVCSAFVGGNPLWPVYEGEIQCRALGCSLYAFDEEGKSLMDEEGEMVITRPMPSMPVFFWGDADGSRYRESYFEMYPGYWRHGDWIRITPREGVIIYGRSDATLNRGGVRMGTSEIYRAVDQVSEVKDSLIVCLERPGGEFWMPLFVVMKEHHQLDDDLRKRINSIIRNAYSPRHVPDEIIEVPDIPYTISGKKTEMPVKKVLQGKDPDKVINTGSLRNPASLKVFRQLFERKNTGA